MNQISICLLLLGSTTLNCYSQEETEFHIDMEVTMVSSGQISPSKKITFENCVFDLVLNQQNDTVYLQTRDASFKTLEGYHVGTDWNSIHNEHRSNLEKMPGWGYYIELDSGWNLGFCEGQSCTDSAPTQGSVVKWIFRRNNY